MLAELTQVQLQLHPKKSDTLQPTFAFAKIFKQL